MNTSNPIRELVDRLLAIAPVIATDYQRHQTAHSDAIDMEGTLLDALVERIADALPAVCGPPGVAKLIEQFEWTLLVNTDGVLFEAQGQGHSGEWSVARIEVDEGVRPIRGCDAVRRFALVPILSALHDQLETQTVKRSRSTGQVIGGRSAAAKRLERSAAIARAALVLLREGAT
jgi:hypothetical protein